MKYLLTLFLGISLFAGSVSALTISSSFQNVLPFQNSKYYLGTTTPSTLSWKGVITDQLCLTADTCRTTWPSSGLSSYDAWTHPLTGDSATTSRMLFNGNASTTGTFEGGGAGGVELYSMGSGVGTLGFNDWGYSAGVGGYGALMQLTPSTGSFDMFVASNAVAGAQHSHITTIHWDNTGLVTLPKGLLSQASSTVVGNFTSTGLGSFGNLLSLASSTFQNFTGLQATTSQATTTNLSVSGAATFTGNLTQTPGAPLYLGGTDQSGTLTGTANINVVQAVVVGRYMYGVTGSGGGACSSTSASGCDGIQIYDVSTSTPTFIGGGTTDGTTNGGTAGTITAAGIAVKGNYAYTLMNGSTTACSQTPGNGAGNGCEFKIWDVSNHSSPQYVGGIDASGSTNSGAGTQNFTDIKVQGRYAYITAAGSGAACSATAAGGCELKIFDISSSTAPVWIGGGDASGVPNGAGGTTNSTFSGIFISGKYAYIAKIGVAGTTCSQAAGSANGCELQVWDISNPYAPTYIGGSASNGLTNSGDSATNFNAVSVQGRFAYVGMQGSTTACTVTPSEAGNGCETQIYDISNPATPTYVAGIDAGGLTNSGTNSVATQITSPLGRYLYVAVSGSASACSQVAGSASGCELKVFDISDPENPLYLGGVDANGSPTGTQNNAMTSLQVVGRNVYVTFNSSGAACSQAAGSAGGCEYKIFDVSGLDVTSIQAGSIEAGTLQVNNDFTVLGTSNLRSLNVGMGGIFSTGPLSVYLASSTSATPISASFLGGNVGIGTVKPVALLDVLGLASSTNFMAFGSTTLQNFTFVNATGTSATTTNFYVSTSASTSALFANNATIGTLTGGFGTLGNLLLNGSSTFQNFTGVNSTTTNATSTNLYTSAQTILAATSGFLGIGTTTPFAFISALGNGTNPLFAVSTSSVAASQKPVFEIDQVGRVNLAGPAPTLSACGTNPVVGSNANDSAGIITIGTGAPKYCLLTFRNTWENTPVCSVVASGPSTSQVGGGVFASTTTTTLGIGEIATSTLASLPGMSLWKIMYMCLNIH